MLYLYIISILSFGLLIVFKFIILLDLFLRGYQKWYPLFYAKC